jgi:protein farnesyltransferase subunit beta
MQQAPEGGFAGRTNKLVDACYSWWVGGCWALIEAGEHLTPQSEPIWNRRNHSPPPFEKANSGVEALSKYLLSCCQHPNGGLRDKPPMNSDFYHSVYSLAGLSATQHHYQYDPEIKCEEEGDQVFKWTVADKFEGEEENKVETCHPVFVLPWGDAERCRRWFMKHGREVKHE